MYTYSASGVLGDAAVVSSMVDEDVQIRFCPLMGHFTGSRIGRDGHSFHERFFCDLD
jgi:hypothetical protein